MEAYFLPKISFPIAWSLSSCVARYLLVAESCLSITVNDVVRIYLGHLFILRNSALENEAFTAFSVATSAFPVNSAVFFAQ